MEIKLQTEQLESTHFRILFELAKQEGPESLQNLLKDLEKLESLKLLGHTAIFTGKHPTLSLISRNKSAIKFLRERKNELIGINFLNFNIISAVNQLTKNPSLLDIYLENSRLLESYKIGNINMASTESGLYEFDTPLELFRDKKRRIEEIVKYYTDGEFICYPLAYSRQLTKKTYELYKPELNREIPATWILRTINRSTGNQYRTIYLESLTFDKTKLPTEEELQSYELPSYLKLQK